MNPRIGDDGNGNTELTPPHGLPAKELLQKHDSDIAALRTNAKTIADSVVELEEWKGEVMAEFAKVHTEIADLATDIRRTTRPPPMREKLDSTIDPVELVHKSAAVALEGERRPDTTPEAEVEKFVLQVVERQRGAMALRDAEKRSKRFEQVLIGLLLVVAAAVIGHYWK